MARWSSIPRFLAFGILAGAMLAAVVAAGIAVVAPRTGAAVPDRRWPGPPPSVVFGPDGAPTAGNVTVGPLVPAAPPRRLLDLVPPDVLAAFEAAEAARGDADDKPDAGPGAFDVDDDTARLRERADAAYQRAKVLAAVSATLLRETGVDFVFVDLLAADAHAVPLVLVDGAVRFRGDAVALREAIRLGTRVVRTEAEGEDVGEVDPAAIHAPMRADATASLVARCRDLLRTSRAILRLPHDPLEVVEARRDGDDVVVRFRDPPAAAALHDLEDRVVATAAVAPDGTVRVRCPDPALDPFRHRLVVRAATRVRWRAAPTVADLVGTPERRLLSADVAEVGAPFAPRVVVANSKTGLPVAGVPVRLALRQGDRVLDQAALVTDAAGTVSRALVVPADAAEGPAALLLDDTSFAIAIRGGLRLSVVVDRPLYRPDDEVHVRLMAHRAATGAPVAAREVRVKLGSVEKTVTTSAHGIASTSFHLVAAEAGPRTVVARAGDTTAEAAFAVRALELPTFTVAVEPPALTLRAGERAPVTVSARYANGTPVVGAKVALVAHDTDVDVMLPVPVTDADGRAAAEVAATDRSRTSPKAAVVAVTDADGRVVRKAIAVTVPRPAVEPRVSIHVLDAPVVGCPCRVELRAPAAARVTLAVAGHSTADPQVSPTGVATHDVEIPASGRAIVTIVPTKPVTDLHVPETDVRVWIDAFEPSSTRPIIVPSARVLTVGDTLAAEVLAEDGVVFVELVREGVPLLGTTVTTVGGRAALAVPLTPDLAGVIDVRAWRLRDETPSGTSVAVLVVRGRSLSVDARPAGDSWRPGETATVEVSVRDRAGRPTAAVLGYWGVDRALLALAPAVPGREEVFDVLPRGHAATDLAWATELGRPWSDGDDRDLLGGVGAPDFDRELKLRHRDAPKRRAAVESETLARVETAAARARVAWLAACNTVPLDEVRTATSLQEVVRTMVTSGHLDARALDDPWGTPYVFGRRVDATSVNGRGWAPLDDALTAPWRSAGPDLRLSSTDPLEGVWAASSPSELGGRLGRLLRFLALRAADRGRPRILGEEVFVGGCDVADFFGPITNNTYIGIGGSAGGAFRGRGGHRYLRAGGGGRASRESDEPVRLRKDFSPTLCFVPEAVVGPDGQATLSIPLKDAITTWDLRFVASAADGAVGTTNAALRVAQPLHAEPWIAPHLTVGDEVDLPVALRNETDAAVAVRARLSVSRELSVVGDAVAAADVGPAGTGAVTFRVRAVAPGRARVRVDVAGGTERDAIERVVVVRPEARAEIETVHATVSAEAPFLAALPVAAAAVHTERRASLYASPLAEVMGSFEGLIACPHG
ncbi:MAG: alpha-2-macroglobulin family protein [Planctomycetota bacterium]